MRFTTTDSLIRDGTSIGRVPVVLLLQAATDTHGDGGILERPGEFPSSRYVSFNLHKDAQRYYKRGPPFLQNLGGDLLRPHDRLSHPAADDSLPVDQDPAPDVPLEGSVAYLPLVSRSHDGRS